MTGGPAALPPPPRALLIAAAVAIVLLLAAASFRRIWEADFWWQYKTGELVAHHGVPHVDTLAYTALGRPWIEMRWLYCDLLYRIVDVAGLPGAVTAKWLALLAAFALAVGAAPWREAPVAACAVVPIAILASTQRFFVRPELVSFLFLALFSWIIARYRSRGGRILFALPLLQVLWSNAHTVFLLGPAIVGLLLVVEAARVFSAARDERAAATRRLATIAAVFALTCGACFATPYGARGIAFGLALHRELSDPVFRQAGAEFVSPFALGQHYTAVFYFEALIAICVVAALASARAFDTFGGLLALSQLYLAATSVRNLPLFCLAAVPFVIGGAARAQLPTRPSLARLLPAARSVVPIVAIGLCLVQSWRLVTDRFHVDQGDSNQFGATLATHRFPEGATRFLKDHPVGGALFNSMFEGSYLAAHDVPVFIDPRLEVHGAEALDRYLRMMTDEAAWRAALGRYDLRAALVGLASPFVRHLAGGSDFRLVYFDEVAAVFVRSGADAGDARPEPVDWAASVARLRSALPSPGTRGGQGFFDRVVSPEPYSRVADFLLRMRHVELAEPFARDALAIDPARPGAHVILAEALGSRGDWDGALREYDAELAVAPENALARRQAGILHFRAGHPARAVELLNRSVEEVPGDAQVWSVLTKLNADAGRSAEALRCAQKAVELQPSHAEYVKNLGRMYAETGNLDEGIANLNRGLELDPEDAGTLGDLALLLLRQGRIGEASAALERGLRLAPSDPLLRRIRDRLGPAAAPGAGGQTSGAGGPFVPTPKAP